RWQGCRRCVPADLSRAVWYRGGIHSRCRLDHRRGGGVPRPANLPARQRERAHVAVAEGGTQREHAAAGNRSRALARLRRPFVGGRWFACGSIVGLQEVGHLATRVANPFRRLLPELAQLLAGFLGEFSDLLAGFLERLVDPCLRLVDQLALLVARFRIRVRVRGQVELLWYRLVIHRILLLGSRMAPWI